MVSFSTEVWLILCIVAGAATVAMLHTLARTFGDQRELHDLKARVQELRKAYKERMATMGQDGEVEVLDEPPG